ncbi:hypothetical protein [Bacillus sp. UNC41MFS5]|uniref:hypothetical protein n=1 Tax=Bacillus sp. UNC41MFS5 TaxID=1449046 RepID=UPI000478B890|nr:hypothetical protein [Bacillus sp. UNC41MFS5]
MELQKHLNKMRKIGSIVTLSTITLIFILLLISKLIFHIITMIDFFIILSGSTCILFFLYLIIEFCYYLYKQKKTNPLIIITISIFIFMAFGMDVRDKAAMFSFAMLSLGLSLSQLLKNGEGEGSEKLRKYSWVPFAVGIVFVIFTFFIPHYFLRSTSYYLLTKAFLDNFYDHVSTDMITILTIAFSFATLGLGKINNTNSKDIMELIEDYNKLTENQKKGIKKIIRHRQKK